MRGLSEETFTTSQPVEVKMCTYPVLNILRNSVRCVSGVTVALACSILIGYSSTPSADEPLQFSDLQRVTDWRKGNNAMLFVHGKDEQWYEAQLDSACMKYAASGDVRFITEERPEPVITEAGEVHRRVSKVIVGQRICTVTSLTKINDPDFENSTKP